MRALLHLPLAALLLLSGASTTAAQVSAGRSRTAIVPSAVYASGHRGRELSRGPIECRPSYESARTWIPGRFEWVTQRVWIPGCRERVWIEPVFELRTDLCGITVRVQISPGHWSWVERPGHWESRRQRVWRPGHWQVRGHAGSYR
jgi:hypothetical protein